MILIELREVKVVQKGTTLLNKISFSLEKGEVVGLVSQSEEAKDVFLQILAGNLLPKEGRIRIKGTVDEGKKAVPRDNFGFLLGKPLMYGNMDIRENLKAIELLVGKANATKREELITFVGLDGIGERKKKLNAYADGMLRRYSIAVALLRNPEAVILEGIVDDLGPIDLQEVREVLIKLKEQGMTMLLTCQEPDNLAGIADRYFYL